MDCCLVHLTWSSTFSSSTNTLVFNTPRIDSVEFEDDAVLHLKADRRGGVFSQCGVFQQRVVFSQVGVCHHCGVSPIMAASPADTFALVVSLVWACLCVPVRMNTVFKEIFTSKIVLDEILAAASLSFCPGLFEILKATSPPTLQWFKSLPSTKSKGTSWGIYDGLCTHNPLMEGSQGRENLDLTAQQLEAMAEETKRRERGYVNSAKSKAYNRNKHDRQFLKDRAANKRSLYPKHKDKWNEKSSIHHKERKARRHYYCKPSGVSCSKPNEWDRHINSDRHNIRCQKLADGIVFECYCEVCDHWSETRNIFWTHTHSQRHLDKVAALEDAATEDVDDNGSSSGSV